MTNCRIAARAPRRCVPLARAAQTPRRPGDPTKGAQKVAMCQGCHGIVGWRTAFPEVYRVPKLVRPESAVPRCRAEGIQERQPRPSDDEGDRRIAVRRRHGRHRRLLLANAAHHGGQMTHRSARCICSPLRSQHSSLGDAPPAADVEAGKKKVQEVCAACHGIDGATPTTPEYPKLAGQYPDYLAEGAARLQVGRAQERDHGRAWRRR